MLWSQDFAPKPHVWCQFASFLQVQYEWHHKSCKNTSADRLLQASPRAEPPATGKAKPKGCPTDCPPPSPCPSALLAATPKPSLMPPQTTDAKLTVQGAATVTPALGTTPPFAHSTRLSAELPQPAGERSCPGDGSSCLRKPDAGCFTSRSRCSWPLGRQSLARPALLRRSRAVPAAVNPPGAISTPRQERPWAPGTSGLPRQRLGTGTALTVLAVGTPRPPAPCPRSPPGQPPPAPRLRAPPGLRGPRHGCPPERGRRHGRGEGWRPRLTGGSAGEADDLLGKATAASRRAAVHAAA